MKLKHPLAACALATLLAPLAAPVHAAVTPAEAKKIGVDAYVYGYSLITTDVTRIQMSNVPKVDGLTAPLGQFINVPRYPPADYRGVSAPNADTLYSIAWVDLTEPQVFTHPAMDDKRFYLFEMTDLWMIDFNTPGTRTQGEGAGKYLLTGPGWKGKVPAGMKQIKSATRYMVILGRTYADGTDADYKKVNELQAQYKITPLSFWGKDYTYQAPPVQPTTYDMKAKPQEVINAMDTSAYFNKMAELMCKDAPPAAYDKAILAQMAKIGVVPCKPFEMNKLPADVQAALADVGKAGMARIDGNQDKIGHKANGWNITTGLGIYNTDYLKRATVAAFGWPANRQEDAVYPYTLVDSDGNKLTGANKYTMTFPKGQTPPVNGFWSITMYMIDGGWWFVPNPLNRFTMSLRNKPKFNADGSLTVYMQNESPGKDLENNWLPAPKGEFIPMLRMYWPKSGKPSSVIDGTWTPPVIKKVG